MQADWEFELGEGAPVIEAAWSGFVDLRLAPARVAELPEAALPALAQALVRLNAPNAPVWTSKCDVWRVKSLADVHFDSFDLDAAEADTAHVLACYIDLLPRSEQQWQLPARAEQACKALCAHLRAAAPACCRADLVVRTARVSPGRDELGVTAYLTACGASEPVARAALSAALHAFEHAVLDSASAAITA